MSFLFPGFLAAAGLVAAGAVLLHLIVTREPDLFPLPTARFAPDRVIQARARAIEPRDLLLLAIRVALVLAAGAALARPVLSPAPHSLIRIVLVDRSRAVARAAEAAESARAVLGERDILILFDSAATVVERGAADSLARLGQVGVPGRLSTGLIGAIRVASRVRDRADSIELIVISPFLGEEADAATDSLRALWPAGIRLVSTPAASDSAPPAVTLLGAPDDPLRMALRVADSGGGEVRVLRRLATGADSSWAAEAGRVLVVWPPVGVALTGWDPKAADTVGAVAVGSTVIVAPFVRTLSWRAAERGGVVVVARWVDGTPAAVESPHGGGCIRSVSIDVPAVGDLVLETRFARLVASLVGHCGGDVSPTPMGDAARARLAGESRTVRALASSFPAPDQVPSPWARWLLLAALLLAGVEMLVRRAAPR